MIQRSDLIELAQKASDFPEDRLAAHALGVACTPALVLELCNLWRAAEAHYDRHPDQTSMAIRLTLKKLEARKTRRSRKAIGELC